MSANKVLYLSIKKRERERMQKLAGIHGGETCVIVGNGPSLTADDLDRICDAGISSFGVNKIYKIFKDTKWRPTYYAIDDRGMIKNSEIMEHLAEMNAEKYFFIKQHCIYQKKLENYISPDKFIFLNSDGNRKYLQNPKFSYDVANKIYSIGTVTYFCIQIAIYLGFKRIYLIGMDHCYPVERDEKGNIIINGGKAHVGEETQKERNIVGTVWEMERAYKCALEESRKKEFEIWNITRGGKLEIFPRKHIEDAIS